MTLLVDAMFDCHRAWSAFSNFTTSKGMHTGIIFGFMRSIRSYTKQFGGAPVVVWDGNPIERKAKLQEYKSGRPSLADGFCSQLPLLSELLCALGVDQFRSPTWEADDCIATLVGRLKSNIIIISGDDDMLQLVDDSANISVFNPKAKVHYSEELVKVKYGVLPSKLTLLWSITGDKSDGIEGIPGLGDDYSSVVVDSTTGDVPDLATKLSSMTVPKAKDLLLSSNMEIVKRNYSLIKMNNQVPDMAHTPSEVSIPRAVEIFTEIESKSFLKELDSWSSFACSSVRQPIPSPIKGEV